MVKVQYHGRLGNNLFQYSVGRILANRYGFYLEAEQIEGFPNTREKIDGKKFPYPEWSRIKLKRNLVDFERLDKKVEKTLNNGNGVCLFVMGTFGRYDNVKDHKEEIKQWFSCDPINIYGLEGRFKIFDGKNYNDVAVGKITENDVLLHIRLGDLLNSRVKSFARALYKDYYDIVLKKIKFDRLFIISDSIDSSHVREFNDYNPIYLFDTSPLDTFRFFSLFNRIIMSRSSYAWWGSWLSDAKEIYFPIPEDFLWGETNLKTDSDMRVDEDRYIYVRQKTREILGEYKKTIGLYPRDTSSVGNG